MSQPKTLILMFHPNPPQSKANRALAAAAATLDEVEIVDMQALYPDGAIDADVEVARLLSADRLVLQFPVQWYSTPALLQAWKDSVLTRMFYIAYEAEGRKLEGTPVLVAATAGNVPENYTATGQAGFTLAELLSPLQATAHRCKLPWGQPFLVYQANRLDDDALAAAGDRYVARLQQWHAC